MQQYGRFEMVYGRLIPAVVLMVLDVVIAPVTGMAQLTWDAAADFSSVMNPNGEWSSGWTSTLGSFFNLYPSMSISSGGVSWYDPAIVQLGAPAFWKNTAGYSQYGAQPGQVLLHPGPSNQFSVLRWTCPFASDYTVSVQFFVGDFGDTDAYVLKNNASVFGAGTTNTNPVFAQTLSLNTGDTIDFAVGSKGSFYGDNTPLNVTITTEGSPTGTIAGTVTLQSTVNNSTLITFDLSSPGMTAVIQVTTAGDGSYVLNDIAAGTYDMAAKGSKWLRQKQSNVVVQSGATANVDFNLRGGDANNSNSVNVLDLNILKGTYGKSEGQQGYDERADFNNSDSVNVLDLNILKGNYGKMGD
jgi:hypothetical protein